MTKPNELIKPLQQLLGLKADGLRGPVTTTAVLQAADEGRLTVIAALQPVMAAPVFIKAPEAGDDIPAAGDAKLEPVHPALRTLIQAASLRCLIPFTVIEGLRTKERQRELVARGASKTMNSRHLTGHAVDLWPLDAAGKALPSGSKQAEARLWADLREISAVVKTVAKERGVQIEWGGDWGWDAPHFQLNRTVYP